MISEDDERRIQQQLNTMTDDEQQLIELYTNTLNQKGVAAAGEILNKLPYPPRDLMQEMLRAARLLHLAAQGGRIRKQREDSNFSA